MNYVEDLSLIFAHSNMQYIADFYVSLAAFFCRSTVPAILVLAYAVFFRSGVSLVSKLFYPLLYG